MSKMIDQAFFLENTPYLLVSHADYPMGTGLLYFIFIYYISWEALILVFLCPSPWTWDNSGRLRPTEAYPV